MSLTSVIYIETLQKNCWTLFFKWEESAYITNNVSVLQSTPEAGHVIHIAVKNSHNGGICIQVKNCLFLTNAAFVIKNY